MKNEKGRPRLCGIKCATSKSKLGHEKRGQSAKLRTSNWMAGLFGVMSLPLGQNTAQAQNAPESPPYLQRAPTDVTQTLSAAFKSKVPETVSLPGGTHIFAPTPFIASSSISLINSSASPTILRLPKGAVCSGGFFRWVNTHHVTIKDLTVDLNGATAPKGICPVINVTGGSGFLIENLHVVHAGAGRWILLSINGASDGNVLNSSFQTSAIQTVQNQGLNVSTSYGHVTNWSFTGNTFTNTGVALSGSGIRFCHNTIRGWGYGAGVSVGKFTSDQVQICDNVISGSDRRRDADGIFPNGIEDWGINTTLVNNRISDVAASGIYIGGWNAHVCANTVIGSGKRADGAGAPGIQVGYVGPAANGNGSVLIGNRVLDDGSGTTSIGFADMPSTRGVLLQGNHFGDTRIPTRIRGDSVQKRGSVGSQC
jgi:hypothetical protein